MKGKTKNILAITASVGILLIILDSKTAMEGAKAGIDLCLKTVIPALFPFLMLTGLITGTLGDAISRIFRPIGRICNMSEGTETILVLGLLGGYPIGAQAVFSGYSSGYLSKQEASRMLTFCNNPGPAFIFGMVGYIFGDMFIPGIMWCIIMMTAIVTAFIQPGSKQAKGIAISKNRSNLMASTIKAMALICGWVVFFRIWISILDRWFFWMIPSEASVFITGLLELSNGVISVVHISNPIFQFCCTAAMLSFGGICVGMQTTSVAGPIMTKRYLLSKLFQMLLTTFFSYWASLALFKASIDPVGISVCLISIILAGLIGYYLRKNSTGNYAIDDI